MNKSLFISIGLCSVIFIIANCINLLPNHFYNIFSKCRLLLCSDYNVKPLLYTIWQVQALISTLTVVILSIMTSLFNKRIYGKRFFSALNIKSNYSTLIFSSIILTSISYFFVAKDMLSATLFLFFSNTIIILYLLYKTIRLIMNPEKLESDIYIWYVREIISEVETENGEANENNINH